MAKLDSFTTRRLLKAIEEIRRQTGQLPTLPALAERGFAEATVKDAVHEGVLECLYVTLSNGVIMKGYKVKQEG